MIRYRYIKNAKEYSITINEDLFFKSIFSCIEYGVKKRYAQLVELSNELEKISE